MFVCTRRKRSISSSACICHFTLIRTILSLYDLPSVQKITNGISVSARHLGSSVCIRANMYCMCGNACLFCCSAVRSTSTRPKVWWRYCLISSRGRTRARTRLSCGTAAPRTSSLWSLWIKVSHTLTRHCGVMLFFVTEHYERRAQR